MRRNTMKDQKSKLRLENLLTKFEKEWMKNTGFKKTSIKQKNTNSKKKNTNSKKKKTNKSKKKKDNKTKKKSNETDDVKQDIISNNNNNNDSDDVKGKELQTFMENNDIWDVMLYTQLCMHNILTGNDLKKLNENDINNIANIVKNNPNKSDNSDEILSKFVKLCKK